MDKPSDKSLLTKVNQNLARMGGAQGKVTAAVSRGDITLTGTLQFEMQRSPIVRAASSVGGVRRVIDQMRISAPKKKWG